MPWEEELRQLDAEFTAGRFGPDEYRRLRDDLLARASSAARPATPPTGQPAAAPTPPAPAAPPDAQELTWRSRNPGADPVPSAPVEQVVEQPPVAVPPVVPVAVWTPPEELAQQISAGHNGTAAAQNGTAAAEAAPVVETAVVVPVDDPALAQATVTQVIEPMAATPVVEPAASPVATLTPAGSPTGYQVLPEAVSAVEPLAEMRGTEPPWMGAAGPGLPPGTVVGGVMVPAGTQRMSSGRAGERLDGAEVFRSARPDSGRRALPVALVVALLVVIAGAVWLFSGNPGSTPVASGGSTGGSPVAAPRASPPTLAQLTTKLPALPGAAKPGTGLVDPAEGVSLGFYSNELAAELKQRGVKQVLLLDTHQGSYNYLMLVVPGGDPTGAERDSELIRNYAASVGMADATIAGVPSQVHATAVSVAGSTVLTGLFHSGQFAVWLGVGMIPAGGQAAVSGEFTRVLHQVLTVAKPD